jgi:ribonuclease R
MSKMPTKKDILDWISAHPTLTSKRDIAKAFHIKGAARINLKRLLKELEEEGHLEKRKKTYRDPDILPPVGVLQVKSLTGEGEVLARPQDWQGTGDEPVVLLIPRRSDPALGVGDRFLAKLTPIPGEEHSYEARLIRRIANTQQRILGVFRKSAEGGRIVPIDKGSDREWRVEAGADGGAKDGELVEAEQAGPKGRMGLPKARIMDRLGDPTAPKAVSLIAIHQHGIPDAFPDAVIEAADGMKAAGLDGRIDLRDMALVTIDPADARDHDDACFAHADNDPENTGGHIVWVAIADVAHYVTSRSVLDKEARMRGNSSYFPDRVVPMLPDRLSGDLCSLHEGVPRACIAVRMQLDAEGNKISHRFVRGLMRSAASLTYQQVQAAMDGTPNEKCAPLLETVIAPLYAAYGALVTARNLRQPLNLDLPERKVVLDETGVVQSINFSDRLDAHRLIEEFMVLANVAAAETLSEKQQPLLFRVHEEPSPEKLESLRETAQSAGFNMAKGQVLKPAHLNRLLDQAAGTDEAELINISTLRSMTQAYYSAVNFGHFGLALRSYAHFTSPIRRYADLVVHRALVSVHGWGNDGLNPDDIDLLEQTGQQISGTERRSMMAERDTTDRYLAAYLSERLGGEFSGRISGIARFGVFVRMDETGADGLIPIRSLGREFFHFDADTSTLTGSDTGLTIGIGQRVTVRLVEAAPVTGGIGLELLTLRDKALPQGPARGRGKPPKRKSVKAKLKSDKAKRKAARRQSSS